VDSVLFPAGLIVERAQLSIEETVQHLLAWDLASEQMEKGCFSAGITAVHTPRIQLHDVDYSHGFMTRGACPEGCVMIGYTLTKGKAVFQNRVLQKNELVITSDGDEIDYLSNTRNRVVTISVQKRLFDNAFYGFFAKPFEAYPAEARFFVEAEQLPYFLERMGEWTSLLKKSRALLLDEERCRVLEQRILEDIFASLMIEEYREKSSGPLIKKARDILHASVDERFDAVTLTRELGISLRQLQRHFKATYGYTPKRYLLNLRINEVRKELLRADPETATISDIALKYHFFDLSHFSKAYKTLFGELPSQTLLRQL